jgi:hypothetical protein
LKKVTTLIENIDFCNVKMVYVFTNIII